MGRSNYGLGTVRQRADGRWEWLAPPSFGRKSLYAKTRKEVLEKARVWVATKPEAPKAKVEDRTFGEATDAFLSASKDRLRTATLKQYGGLLRTHVLPRRGQLPVDRLEPAHVEALYTELRSGGVSVRTLQAVHIAIRQVTKFATQKRWIEVDPMSRVRRPGGSRQAKVKGEDAIRYWSAEELRRVLDAAREVLPPEHALIFEVLAGTGCRIAECLGLQYRDHRGGKLTFARTWSKARKVEPTKSASSRRTIEIAASLSQAIGEVRRAKGVTKLDDFIFATRTGKPIDQDHVRARLLPKVIAAADVPTRTLHEIRHSHAVILLEAQTPLKVVQERLGHQDPATTIETYSHVTARLEGGAVAALTRALD